MNTFTCTSMLHVSNTQGINMVSMEDITLKSLNVRFIHFLHVYNRLLVVVKDIKLPVHAICTCIPIC